MGALRIFGIVLIGIAVFLLIFVFEASMYPEWFLIGMILPSIIMGVLLIIAHEKNENSE